jgi:hypothetical protein
MKTQITEARDGIIIIDIINGFRSAQGVESPNQTEIPVRVDKMDFELRDDTYRIVDIGNSTLTPTVKTEVTGFVFDEANKTIKVLGANDETLYEASTDERLVQVRVNFRTASITVYE